MTIVTTIAESEYGKYHRCLRALRNSIADTNPDAQLEVITADPAEYSIEGVKPGWINNHEKLRRFSAHGIHDDTIFCDVDTLFLRDANALFEEDFDIAIGVRPAGRVRYNGGVVAMRGTRAAREFLGNWATIDHKMLYDRAFHDRWRAKYNGMNQASFGYMIESAPHSVRLQEYPNAVINACEQEWERLRDINPVVMHVRKRLLMWAQKACPIEQVPRELREAALTWRRYEQKYATEGTFDPPADRIIGEYR